MQPAKRKFVTMKWGAKTTGSSSKDRSSYENLHVNNVFKMLESTQNYDFELICLSDCPEGLMKEIRFEPLPDILISMIKMKGGGNFAKLYLFSDEFKRIAPDRFVFMDLDVAIFGDLSHLFESTSDFLILEGTRNNKISKFSHRRHDKKSLVGLWENLNDGGLRSALYYIVYGGKRWCRFNSSIMSIGERRKDFWSDFDVTSARESIKNMRLVGSDQAWLHIKCDEGFELLSEQVGYWRHKKFKEYFSRHRHFPENLKFVAFPGDRNEKPWFVRKKRGYSWVSKAYPK